MPCLSTTNARGGGRRAGPGPAMRPGHALRGSAYSGLTRSPRPKVLGFASVEDLQAILTARSEFASAPLRHTRAKKCTDPTGRLELVQKLPVASIFRTE